MNAIVDACVLSLQALSDAIAARISDTLQPMVQAKFEECFTPLFTNMAGSFEKSCNAMCQQINAALSTGTAECVFVCVCVRACVCVCVTVWVWV